MSFSASRRLGILKEQKRLRALRTIAPCQGSQVEVDGKLLTLFSSNDYLGLSSHPEVKRALSKAAEQWGMGPRGASLICGYTSSHELL